MNSYSPSPLSGEGVFDRFTLLAAVLACTISFAQKAQNPNPYAIFGGSPYVIGTESGQEQAKAFVIDNLAEGSEVAWLEHNPKTGLVKFFDAANKLIGERLVAPGERAWPTPDPKAEKYYSISPYAYALNNPVRYVDPFGEDVYLYYYASGDDEKDNAMFWAAALTRATNMLKSGKIKEGDTYRIQGISDLGQLGASIEKDIAELSPTYGQTAEFGLWSHGALDGPRGSVASSRGPIGANQMSAEEWGNIDFNWKESGANAMFFGCRTASGKDDSGNAVTPWAQTISMNENMNGVNVYGQTTRSYPSGLPFMGITSPGALLGNHKVPTYMVGSDRGGWAGVNRYLGIPNRAYPMAGYRNGRYIGKP